MSWLLPSTCRTPQFTMAVPKGRASFLSFCKASRVPKDARPPLKRIWGKQGVLQSFWSCCIKVRKPLQHDETNQLRLSPNDPRILAKWKMDFWDSHNCLASRDTWKKKHPNTSKWYHIYLDQRFYSTALHHWDSNFHNYSTKPALIEGQVALRPNIIFWTVYALPTVLNW